MSIIDMTPIAGYSGFVKYYHRPKPSVTAYVVTKEELDFFSEMLLSEINKKKVRVLFVLELSQ